MKFIIIDAKEWVKGKGTNPYRIVLTATRSRPHDNWQEDTERAYEFTTHQQIDATQDNGKVYLASGHYYQTLEDAIEDFEERV